MSDPRNLNELYIEELQDLWSANSQMSDVVEEMAGVASDKKLADQFRQSVKGIRKHTETLKQLIEDAGGECKKEHCKGMEGLTKEARKHVVKSDSEGAVRDVAAIAQFQRAIGGRHQPPIAQIYRVVVMQRDRLRRAFAATGGQNQRANARR